MADGDFRYWAFISYSSKDAVVATRLHRKLETYRIPRTLVGRPGRDGGVPRKLFPVFRDRDELPLSSDLGETIHDALRGSRYLIVICTPNAAISRWVNEEIRYFKSLGREDRILAIIANGEPNATDRPGEEQRECFPLALRYRVAADGGMTNQRTEPIGGDLRRNGDGWNRVLLKSVAGITGLGYDAFAKREAKRTLRRRVAMSILAMLILCAGLIYWDYARLKVGYFAFEADRWGIPEGVTPLSDSERAGKETAYRVEYRKYKVRRVAKVNSAGSLVSDMENSNAALTEVLYREDGSLERLLLRDTNGKLVLQKAYSRPGPVNDSGLRPCTISFQSQAEFAQSLRADAGSLTAEGQNDETRKSDITTHQVYFNSAGLVERVSFRNSYGSPVADTSGVYGRKFEYDRNGLVIRKTNLDSRALPLPDRKGVGSIRQDRDSAGYVIRQSFLDSQDRLVRGPDKVAVFETERDAFKNIAAWRYLGTDSKPALHAQGYSVARFKYDARGLEVGGAYFGIDGQPAVNTNGYSSYTTDYDDRGFVTRFNCLNRDNKPTDTRFGYASMAVACDSRGNVTDLRFLNAVGNPTTSGGDTGGFSRRVNVYDSHGNNIDSQLFDVAGKPTLSKSGVNRIRQMFDDQDNLIEQDFLGVDGNPTLNSEAISRIVSVFDERGNEVETSYFGVDGGLTLNKDGCARVASKFDDRGSLIERRYFGTGGKPIAHHDGYAKLTNVIDIRGNVAVVAYFDVYGTPTLCKNGFARKVNQYDEQGQATRSDYFGADGLPILETHGRARMVRTFDARGNEVQEKFFGVTYLPAADSSGVASIQTEYDDRGNIRSARFFDTAGRPVMHKAKNIAALATKFDDRGNLVEIATFGTSGEPIRAGDENVPRQTRIYDDKNNLIEDRFFEGDGRPTVGHDGVAVKLVGYDDRGDQISQSFLDVRGKPAAQNNGVARTRAVYDAMGRRIEESYFGIDGHPVLDGDGVARLTARYDDRGNCTGQSFYGADGQFILAQTGYANSILKYDSRGNCVESRFYGADGAPVLGPQHAWRMTGTYDTLGHSIDVAFYGVDGKPCSGDEGYARITKKYDSKGREIEEAYFGESDQPVNMRGPYAGCARITIRYDARGDVLERDYWGVRGEPVLSAEHAARCVYRYDEMGTIVELACYGVDGSLIMMTEGFARAVQTVDENGRLKETAYYDTGGRLVKSRKGFARRTYVRDASGDVTEDAFWGPNNELVAPKDDGVARTVAVYDGRGLPLEEQRFGADGKPLVSDTLAYSETVSYYPSGILEKGTSRFFSPEAAASLEGMRATRRLECRYDTAGNAIECVSSRPLLGRERSTGAVVERTRTDASGAIVETAYFNADGKLVMGPGGFAREADQHDERGRIVGGENFDANGNRVVTLLGFSSAKMQLDDLGRMTEIRSFDANGSPVVSKDLPYRVTQEFGQSAKPLERTEYYQLPRSVRRTKDGSPPVHTVEKFNGRGEPLATIVYREFSGRAVEGNLVFSKIRLDAARHVTESAFVDSNEHLMAGPTGFARKTQAYDPNGMLVETRVFDAKGEPTVDVSGAAAVLMKRDEKGQVLATSYLGVDCKPTRSSEGFAVSTTLYDDRGRPREQAYLDVDGRPCVVPKLGFAKMISTYDDANHSVEQSYYDVNGSLTRSIMGVYRRIAVNDGSGRNTDERFLDADRRPMKNNQGVAEIKRIFGTGTEPIEVAVFDESGNSCRSVFGYSKTRYVRDARGNATSEQYLDEKDQPAALPPFGCDRIETTYDDNNRPVTREYTLTIAAPMAANGVVRINEMLDERGNATDRRYLDGSGRFVEVDGCTGMHVDFDATGRNTCQTLVDKDSQPTNGKDGYCRFTQRYVGTVRTEAAYFDKNGGLVVGPTGWAKLVRNSVSDGGAAKWSVLDAAGLPAATEVVIYQLVQGGQAAKLGVRLGDVIVSYNNVQIVDFSQLFELIDLGGESDRHIVLDRAGSRVDLQVHKGKIGAALKTRHRNSG